MMKTDYRKSASRFVFLGLLAAAAAGFAHAQRPENPQTALVQQSAARFAMPSSNQLLDAAHAGNRIVAVGDRGVVLLSEDDGRTYRQARSVPTRATLTAVTFVDAQNGWAAGHWGVILHTADGGETWTLQRDDTEVDQPLFSIWFKDNRVGYAAGLWSLVLRTEDGGKTWTEAEIPPPAGSSRADRNLFRLFADERGNLFAAAERGVVYKSSDDGLTWRAVETGSKGTFWAGIALKGGVLLVGGLQGPIYRSTDEGETWAEIQTGTKSSITAIRQFPDLGVVAVGLDGVVLHSSDGGVSFRAAVREDKASLTAVAVGANNAPLLFSMQGVVDPLQP